jgi:putative ABC transport system permease protein
MRRNFGFYIRYALRNLWRNRRWSIFALLAVAAGVATVVALRSLGLAIEDSLTGNVRSVNHGDITLSKGAGNPLAAGPEQTRSLDVFTEPEVAQISNWAAENDARLTRYTETNLQVIAADQLNAGTFDFMSTIFIDPATYPLTQDIIALQPSGVPLRDLFTGERAAVISENLARNQSLDVGDAIRVSGSEATFTVRGIVPTAAEASLRDPFAAFFGFVYFEQSQRETFSIDARPNRISVVLPPGTSNVVIAQAANELDGILRGYTGIHRVVSVPSLLEQNETIANVSGRFVLVMGLGAMLLGGVGIINTMLVIVRRRTLEIAAMKTVGVGGGQIATLFMIEAFIVGLGGSIAGVVIGAGLTLLSYQYGEAFVLQTVAWQLYPQALVFGLLLGLTVTIVFSLIPVLVAVKVRPASILRPNEAHIPALGLAQSASVVLVMVLVLGLITGAIIGPLPGGLHYLVGVVGVVVTLVILSLLVGVLWLFVWLIGHFPTLGLVDLQLVLRNLSTQRIRTAITLLAIATGMFALSGITLYGAGTREILSGTLTGTLGGNVLILSPATLSPVTAIAERDQQRIEDRLSTLDGVTYRTRILNFDGRVFSIDGRPQLGVPRAQNGVNIVVRDTDNPALEGPPVEQGRGLHRSDRGSAVAVVRLTPYLRENDVRVGSTLRLHLTNGEAFTFEVVGTFADTRQDLQSALAFADVQVPPGTLGNALPVGRLNAIYVEEDRKTEVMLSLSALTGVYPVDVTFIDRVLGRLVEQFSALPLLVGLLSLGAAAVIMANTVALATQERRQQIGVLKALGLQSRRVLGILLLENVLVSLFGALIGIGLSMLGMVLLSLVGLGEVIVLPADARPVMLGLVLAAVGIGVGATLLSAGATVRDRTLSILRND